MSESLNWVDRLRIERAVWTLDQRLYDLPRQSRIAKRREVRANLVTAAHDVGTGEALRHLGNSSQLASAYLSAEFGDEPRASWVAAAVYVVTLPLVLIALLGEATLAFRDGIVAANPHASGTFTWRGVSYVQSDITYTFVDGHATWVGGALTPFVYVCLIVGAILIGRLWRALPAYRRRRELVK